MKNRVPRNELRQVRRVKAEAQSDVAQEYIALSQASTITGLSHQKLLDFCSEHGVAHMKYQNRWMIHSRELLNAYSQHG